MPTDKTKELLALKQKAESLQLEHSRAQGALEQVLQRLKKEYNCNSLEAAEKRAEELNAEAEKARQVFELELEKFKQEYGANL